MRLAILAFLASPLSLLANGGGYYYGNPAIGELGLFQPKQVEKVEMREERLNIDLHIEFARIEVEYVLHNPGEAVNIEAGFPCTRAEDLVRRVDAATGQPARRKLPPPFRAFALSADDAAVPWRVVEDGPMPPEFKTARLERKEGGEFTPARPVPVWYVFELSFAAGQTRRFKAVYETPYTGSKFHVSEDSDSSPAVLEYLLSTARVWKGPIGRGEVTVRGCGVDPAQVVFRGPKRFSRAAGSEPVWHWSFRNLEPSLADDLQIVVRPARTEYERGFRRAAEEGQERTFLAYVVESGRWRVEQTNYKIEASSTRSAKMTTAASEEFARRQASGEGRYDGDATRALDLAGQDFGAHWLRTWEGAWQSAGDGLGDTLTIRPAKPGNYRRIGLRNGWVFNEDEYRRHARVAEFEVRVDGGKPQRVSVPDERLSDEWFHFDLPPARTVSTIELKITKLHPAGEPGKGVCLSRLVLVEPLTRKPKVQGAR